jgi:hypothetical protein
MAGDLDPHYAARFQRGYEPGPEAESPDAARDAEDVVASDPARSRRAPGAVLLVAAGTLAAAAIGGVAWTVLDPAFLAPPVPDPVAAVRLLARAAPGPFAVAAVLAVSGGLALLGLPRRVVVGASALAVVALVAVVGWVVTEFVRLASLTAQGPVSSGGIPLPEPALTTYHQRVQTLVVFDGLLPWLVAAAVLELVVTGVLAGILSPRRLG